MDFPEVFGSSSNSNICLFIIREKDLSVWYAEQTSAELGLLDISEVLANVLRIEQAVCWIAQKLSVPFIYIFSYVLCIKVFVPIQT